MIRLLLERFRVWLSHKLHLWAAYIHDDFHILELITPQGDVVTFAAYWDWTGDWPDEWEERCSCDIPELLE